MTLAGSPSYLAPEVINNTGCGKPADIYGIGIILFEMLAGYPPFQGSSLSSLVANIRGNKIKFPSHFSKEAKNLIQSCMNR